MAELIRRSSGPLQTTWSDQMDRVFDEWFRRRPFGLDIAGPGAGVIRVDEYLDDDTRVVRAELPGIDPAEDVELTVTDGMLRIKAERRTESESEDKGYLRHELHHGTYQRTLPLPEGVDEDAIAASYKNGILEIRIPNPPAAPGRGPRKIAVSAG